MAMQSKQQFENTTLADNKKLPFQLVLLIGESRQEIPITKLTTNSRKILENMYNIEELVNLKIKVKANTDDSLYINWGNVSDRDEDMNISFVLDEKQQIYTLFSNENSKEEYPWRCGTYHFEIKYKDQTYYGGFNVTPRNINEHQLSKIHEFINSHVEGLAVDYLNYKKTFSDLSKLENSSHWQFIQWYKKMEQKIYQSLNMIENNSQKGLKKIYLIENEPKRMDSRSIRWENTAKGQALKGNSFLNRKLILDSDSEVNRLVKFRLRLLASKIDSSIDIINEIRNELENKRKEVTDEVASLNIQVDKVQLNRRVTDKDKKRIENTLNSKKIEQRKIEENVERLNKIQQNLNRSKKLLYSRLSSAFWIKIGDRPPKKLQLENYAGYQLFQQIWSQYSQSLPEKSQKAFKLPVYRPTYELYEYFVLLSVLNMMVELGFKAYKDSVEEQLMATFYESGLTDGTTVFFQKDHMRVDVIYEGMVEYSDEAALESKTHFFSLGNHRKPDIRIDLYFKNNNDEWEYDSSFIIEVKYSPFHNIYNHFGKTKAMEQMTDYWNITYAYYKGKYKRNSIENVICVYPGEREAPIYRSTAPGIFLQYYPSDESDQTDDIVGKVELKEFIHSWIEKK